jgi:hypothetical protein
MYYLVLDIETAPIANAADFLPVDECAAPSNYTDPVKIAAYIEKEQRKLVASATLDLDLARIVAIGTWTRECERPAVITLQDEDGERIALETLAARLRPARDGNNAHLITFNGSRYDLPLLMRRARYLGVRFPEINLDRYKSPHFDLYELLTNRGALKAHSLRWYFRRLDYVDLLEADPLEKGGGDVGKAIAEGRWDDVAAHCRCDIEGTVRLARWLGILPPLEAVA